MTWQKGENIESRKSAGDPYCEFRNDRERRNALMSRDVRLVLCRLLSVGGIVAIALLSPVGIDLKLTLTRLLGSL